MTFTVYEGTIKHELPFGEGDTILAALQSAGIESVTAPCGGKGSCKKCTVFVRSGEFTGACLACTTPVREGMAVELEPEIRFSVAESSGAEPWKPTPGQSGYAAACDVGTTTVVCQLLDLADGKPLATVSGSNSQRIFGGDVLSRLKAAEEGHAEELHSQIVTQVNYFLAELCRKAEIPREELRRLAVTGNTIMMHLFAGLDPAQISTAPFTPASLFGRTLSGRDVGLDFAGEVYLCPAVSGFIGSDVVCGVLACGMGEKTADSMLIDLGANTEIVIGNREKMTACAVDGGAAFKASLLDHGMIAAAGAISGVKREGDGLVLEVLGGGRPKGICGSGFIDLLGVLYEEEILDEMGRLADPEETDSPLARYLGEEDGRAVFYLTEDRKLFISRTDISKFQLAKAAISAGIQILGEESGIPFGKLDRLALGGGFGAFGHRKNSALLGIIPRQCKGKTVKLGNLALTGAVSAAVSARARSELERLAKIVRVVDLPTHPSFGDAYTEGMLFE